MSKLTDEYTDDPVKEAGDLTERQLAALLLPSEEPGEDAALQEEATQRAQEILNLAVATREGKKCAGEGCHSEATWLIDYGDHTAQSCQEHLAGLVDDACTITQLSAVA